MLYTSCYNHIFVIIIVIIVTIIIAIIVVLTFQPVLYFSSRHRDAAGSAGEKQKPSLGAAREGERMDS